MLKFYLLPMVLLGGLAIAADESIDEPLMFIKGDITKAQFMERAEQRFARQDTDKDGTLSVAEREAAMARMHEAMQQSGQAMPGKMGNMGNMRPMQDTTKAQFMARMRPSSPGWTRTGTGYSTRPSGPAPGGGSVRAPWRPRNRLVSFQMKKSPVVIPGSLHALLG